MKTISPYRQIVTSFSASQQQLQQSGFEYDSGEYILSIASSSSSSPSPHQQQQSSPSNNVIAAALSNQSIVLYDATAGQITSRIEGAHDGPISEIDFFPSEYAGNDTNCSLIISASQDGTVKVFDIRTNNSSKSASTAAMHMKLQLPNEQALSVSLGYGGTLAAVGTNKARVSFFDLRYTSAAAAAGGAGAAGTLMGSYVDAHTEEVTQVCFQTTDQSKTVLATASEDGLLAIHDPSQPSEDAALLSVLNIGSPIRNAGFFGPTYEGVYALTGNETMSVWHWDSAQKVSDVGGYGLRGLLSDAVRNTGGSASGSSAMASAMEDDGGSAIEYLVGCTWAPMDDGASTANTSLQSQVAVSSPALHLLAGNSHGDGFLFRMDADQITPVMQLNGGHKGCIRDFCWVDGNGGKILVTGGEDARLCEWDLSGRSSHAGAGGAGRKSRGEGGGPISGRSAKGNGNCAKGKKKIGSPY